MTEHSFYMERAIQLAKRGTGFTNPNPLVGAVIVKDHRIIGEGWHARYGDLHAERNALKQKQLQRPKLPVPLRKLPRSPAFPCGTA